MTIAIAPDRHHSTIGPGSSSLSGPSVSIDYVVQVSALRTEGPRTEDLLVIICLICGTPMPPGESTENAAVQIVIPITGVALVTYLLHRLAKWISVVHRRGKTKTKKRPADTCEEC